jgi:hypothetical protein
MRKTHVQILGLGSLLVAIATAAVAQDAASPQTFPLTDTKALAPKGVIVEAASYKGRNAVRLTRDTEDEGYAVVSGTDFQDGTIEVDLAVKVAVSSGPGMPGFAGVAFRARPDASHYELFYLRPGNSSSEDQAKRNHTVQYCAAPDHGWYRLRREWPWVYEAHAELELETWTKVKIEVAGRSARLYLKDSSKPTLRVDGLKGEDLRGAVALWGYAGEETYFSNLRITPGKPQPIQNGSDPAGTWRTKLMTDAGMYDGQLSLTREGTKIIGKWSGSLGENLPVRGTWRNGYVELQFTGEWGKDRPQGAPGPAVATLAGWVDGATARGRVKIDGRADGQWVASRPSP